MLVSKYIEAGVICTLASWPAVARYCDDGHVEIDNNNADRALRAVAPGRENYLFAGADSGSECTAATYSLPSSAKLNSLSLEAYLRHVLGRIAQLSPYKSTSS